MIFRVAFFFALAVCRLAAGEEPEDDMKVDIASVKAQGENVLKELSHALAPKSDANYHFPSGLHKPLAKGQYSHLYDPHRNLFPPKRYDAPILYYDVVDQKQASIPLKRSQYPSYDMYHSTKPQPKGKKPVMSHYPCCHYSPYMESKNIQYNPKTRSPHQNCRTLVNAFLKDHPTEHHGHRCTYGEPYGGPVDYTRNSGEYRHEYGRYADVIILGKGACVNAHFNVPPGAHIEAPQVTPSGQCKSAYSGTPPKMEYYETSHERRLAPYQRRLEDEDSVVESYRVHQRMLEDEDSVVDDHHHPVHQRRLSASEQAHQRGLAAGEFYSDGYGPARSHHPPRGYGPHETSLDGYDYFLECSCLCEKPTHADYKPYSYTRVGYA